MTAKKSTSKSREVKPDVQPGQGGFSMGIGFSERAPRTCPVHPNGCVGGGPRLLGMISFTTRKYPDCESPACKHSQVGMKAERADKRDRCCTGCGEELKVVIQAREDYCRECGRAQADFILVCPNERWWNIFGGHFIREYLGSGRLFDDTSDEAKKADEAARARV